MRVVQLVPAQRQLVQPLLLAAPLLLHEAGVEPQVEGAVLVALGDGVGRGLEEQPDVPVQGGAVEQVDPQGVLVVGVVDAAVALPAEVRAEHLVGPALADLEPEVGAVAAADAAHAVDLDRLEDERAARGELAAQVAPHALKVAHVPALAWRLNALNDKVNSAH